jgi:hypothetical protein
MNLVERSALGDQAPLWIIPSPVTARGLDGSDSGRLHQEDLLSLQLSLKLHRLRSSSSTECAKGHSPVEAFWKRQTATGGESSEMLSHSLASIRGNARPYGSRVQQRWGISE